MRKEYTTTAALVFTLIAILATQTFAADSITQKNWLSQFEGYFTSSLCEKKEFVSTCLKSSVSECKLTVREQLNSCSKSIHLPEKIQIGRDSELWGEKMGGCLAPKLVSRSGNNKEDAKCKNLSAW